MENMRNIFLKNLWLQGAHSRTTGITASRNVKSEASCETNTPPWAELIPQNSERYDWLDIRDFQLYKYCRAKQAATVAFSTSRNMLVQ